MHLPKSVLKNKEGMGWAYRVMSLSHNDIIWTLKGMDEEAIINLCGEYPNVPLLGTHGGISYNPCLALRQFGRARREGPHERLMVTFPDYQLVPTLEEFAQLLRILILNQLPFNGTERDPNPEDIAQALHLQPSDIIGHWETRSCRQIRLCRMNRATTFLVTVA